MSETAQGQRTAGDNLYPGGYVMVLKSDVNIPGPMPTEGVRTRTHAPHIHGMPFKIVAVQHPYVYCHRPPVCGMPTRIILDTRDVTLVTPDDAYVAAFWGPDGQPTPNQTEAPSAADAYDITEANETGTRLMQVIHGLGIIQGVLAGIATMLRNESLSELSSSMASDVEWLRRAAWVSMTVRDE